MLRGVLYSQALCEERCRDLLPLHLERLTALGLLRAAIPIPSVSKIPLFAMQISMNPGASHIIDVLCDLVGGIPFASGIVPESA
jgi:hypothetical protein